jgi:uncharacterized protein YecE (DUF72 family)
MKKAYTTEELRGLAKDLAALSRAGKEDYFFVCDENVFIDELDNFLNWLQSREKLHTKFQFHESERINTKQ